MDPALGEACLGHAARPSPPYCKYLECSSLNYNLNVQEPRSLTKLLQQMRKGLQARCACASHCCQSKACSRQINNMTIHFNIHAHVVFLRYICTLYTSPKMMQADDLVRSCIDCSYTKAHPIWPCTLCIICRMNIKPKAIYSYTVYMQLLVVPPLIASIISWYLILPGAIATKSSSIDRHTSLTMFLPAHGQWQSNCRCLNTLNQLNQIFLVRGHATTGGPWSSAKLLWSWVLHPWPCPRAWEPHPAKAQLQQKKQ